jgi:hypothetical protein
MKLLGFPKIAVKRPCPICGGIKRYWPSIILRVGMAASPHPLTCDVCDATGIIPADRPGVEHAMAELRAKLPK